MTPTTDPERLILAAVTLGLWLLLVAVIAVRQWRSRPKPVAATSDRDTVLIAYASQTGFGEELAVMTAKALETGGLPVRIAPLGQVDATLLASVNRAFFIASTTGEGDAPDPALRFLRRTMTEASDLSSLTYGLLMLGDRSYRNYCAFGHALDGWLRGSGARPLFDAVEVDDGDAGAIRHWQHQVNLIAGVEAAPDWTPPAFDRWRLVERTLVNPDSPGGEMWRLALEPISSPLVWTAGDIAEVGVPSKDGETPGSREYSIASLPSDGRLELLVRLMTYPDGSPGLASGWLTRDCPVGGEVNLRVRTNRAFHPPAPGAPLILIGNGTGLAGLAAHLRDRAEANAEPNWLLFGERSSAHDRPFAADIDGWRASGVLTETDLVFSRDQTERLYVQHRLAERADLIRAWADQGATILVCGSLEGMASGVDQALRTALGDDRLNAMAEAGLYRRDVY